MGITYASQSKRIWAAVIDDILLLITGLGYSIAISLALVFLGIELSDFGAAIAGLSWTFLFHFLQLLLLKGRTIGKIFLKLRVVDVETFDTPTIGAYAIRVLLSWVSLSIVANLASSPGGMVYALVGLSTAKRDANNQSLWDKASKTTVIDESISR